MNKSGNWSFEKLFYDVVFEQRLPGVYILSNFVALCAIIMCVSWCQRVFLCVSLHWLTFEYVEYSRSVVTVCMLYRVGQKCAPAKLSTVSIKLYENLPIGLDFFGQIKVPTKRYNSVLVLNILCVT